jgi:hypothetical protein
VDAHQDESIGRRVGARIVVRDDVDVIVPGAGVVLPEVDERRVPELGELPAIPVPSGAMIPRPGELALLSV